MRRLAEAALALALVACDYQPRPGSARPKESPGASAPVPGVTATAVEPGACRVTLAVDGMT